MKNPNQNKNKTKKEKQVNEITCKITLSRHDMTGAIPRKSELSHYEYRSYNNVAAISPPDKPDEQ